jgi:hypothetical protein
MQVKELWKRLQMKKRSAIILSTFLIATVLASAFLVYQSYSLPAKPFHVGVTYCGNSVQEAEQLIDKVKNYTNLFVLQSGRLQENLSAVTEICDYAVDNKLDVIVYFGSYYAQNKFDDIQLFLNSSMRWGSHLLGLYYGDEPGGKMLDGPSDLYDPEKNEKISKNSNGGIETRISNDTTISYYPDGAIFISKMWTENNTFQYNHLNYFKNGTIWNITPDKLFIFEFNGKVTINDWITNSTVKLVNTTAISQFEPYEKLWEARPLKNSDDADDAARLFVATQNSIVHQVRNWSDVKIFTADYGLYWWDYLGGYDVVLAEFGWNHTETQHVGLVRGAATLQGKSWGAMLTWKNSQAPYLASGEEMHNQMTMAYNGGAEYVVVFNYSPDGDGVGLLQDEHFEALERFWNEHVVPNNEKAKTVKAEAVLVLPTDYGWGMRNPEDNIWGLWQADDKAPQVWNALQNALEVYGKKIDIVYDAAFPVSGYQKVLFWNQTG